MDMDNLSFSRGDVEGLKFYFENSSEVDGGVSEKLLSVLDGILGAMDAAAEAEAKRRRSPNRSGVVQLDATTGKILAEYATQKEALAAIGKDGKSGLGDALNGRTRTHKAYGYVWVFKSELDEFKKANF